MQPIKAVWSLLYTPWFSSSKENDTYGIHLFFNNNFLSYSQRKFAVNLLELLRAYESLKLQSTVTEESLKSSVVLCDSKKLFCFQELSTILQTSRAPWTKRSEGSRFYWIKNPDFGLDKFVRRVQKYSYILINPLVLIRLDTTLLAFKIFA